LLPIFAIFDDFVKLRPLIFGQKDVEGLVDKEPIEISSKQRQNGFTNNVPSGGC